RPAQPGGNNPRPPPPQPRKQGQGGHPPPPPPPSPPLSRYPDGRPQQPAAGGAPHLRLQDGRVARRDAAPPRTAGAAQAPCPGRRVRRRSRDAGIARE